MRIDIASENLMARLNLPGSAIQLSCFRIAIGGFIFYVANSKLFEFLKVVGTPVGTHTIFPNWFDTAIANIAVPELQIATQVFSLGLMVGLLTRIIAPILFVLVLLLFSFWYRHFDAPVPWLYLWFPLLLLCFSRCADCLSVDSVFRSRKLDGNRSRQAYRWPVELMSGWFVYIYFAAGLAKIIPLHNLQSWMQGGTSQQIIYYRFLDSQFYYIFGRPFFDYTQHAWVFGVLSTAAVVLELATIVIVFTARYNVVILGLVLCMHIFLHAAGVCGFLGSAVLLGLCLLPPKWFAIKEIKVVE